MGYVYAEAKNENAVLKIVYDESADSPREWDNLSTIISFHNRYSLGDKHNYSNTDELLFTLLEEYYGDTANAEKTITRIENRIDYRDYKSYSENKKAVHDEIFAILSKKYIILPLYLYDHGVQSISTGSFIGRTHNAEWDSGQVGWVYVSKDKIRNKFGVKRITKNIEEKALNAIESEVEVYNQYIMGDVYGFIIEDKEGNRLDSCWGFYGYDMIENGMKDCIPNDYLELLEQIA